MLLNALRIYFLDLSHCIETNYLQEIDDNPSREDVYFQQFLTLILKHYKTEHLVQFYADHIHITSHYLTQIVKKLTGQTVSDFIFDLLYSEARQLLKQPDLTVQEIADILNFSDQSAFGKFFKRKSGMSPLSFRKL
ncbi:helix-turn-helix domain-containing protein [Flavobacterium agricola]|uniref:Helix-turn-helix domain-containing protein n=1 Tax=Flavobacterium agricola TaxID=2870839 RepID=A0ABY6M1L7_9FLAO|nr:helix-turn-helix domain-containing protein [Flavobacterium agricola]UYW02326.1 helix-turn-helix domain-containing protein [Flavobacterium agricola]